MNQIMGGLVIVTTVYVRCCPERPHGIEAALEWHRFSQGKSP